MDVQQNASQSKPSRPGGVLGMVTTRPVAITMFMVALAVFGAVSFAKLRVNLLPEISYPTLTVRTNWEGAAPEDVEQRVSERVQEALATLPNLVRSTSTSRAGISDVVLDFDWGTSMTFAVQDVRERLDGVVLPRGVERPLILRYDPNLDPILRIGVTTAADKVCGAPVTTRSIAELIQLRWLAEKPHQARAGGDPTAWPRFRCAAASRRRSAFAVDPYKLAALRHRPRPRWRQRLAQENINAFGAVSCARARPSTSCGRSTSSATLEEIAAPGPRRARAEPSSASATWGRSSARTRSARSSAASAAARRWRSRSTATPARTSSTSPNRTCASACCSAPRSSGAEELAEDQARSVAVRVA